MLGGLGLKIPDEHKTVFVRWMRDEGARTDQVLELVAELEPRLLVSDLAKELSRKASLDESASRELLTLLAAMSRAATDYRNGQGADFANAVYLAATGTELVNDPAGAEIRSRIDRAIATRSVEITGKALLLMAEQERSFHTARIVSDLRPVFTENQLKPSAAVVVHQLRLSYHTSDGEIGDIFVALDKNDLKKLAAIVERALKKHEALQGLADGLNLPVLGAGEQ